MTKISIIYFVNRYISFMVKYFFLPFVALVYVISSEHDIFYLIFAAFFYLVFFSFFPWFPMRQANVYTDNTVLIINKGRNKEIIEIDAIEEIYYRTSTTNLGKPWSIQICIIYNTGKFANFLYLIPYEQRYFENTHEYSNEGFFMDEAENFYRMTNNFFNNVPIRLLTNS